ncbi:CoA-transferase [Chloroflexota bacterium]
MGKVLTLPEVVTTFIEDGSHIAIGGFASTRNPMAITYEIIIQEEVPSKLRKIPALI